MYTLKIIFITILAGESLYRIFLIDKDREPVTRAEAILGLILSGTLIYVLFNSL